MTLNQSRYQLFFVLRLNLPACRYRNLSLFGTDRTTTTKAASVREQLGPKNSKSNEGRQAKNGGVKGRDGSAEELDRETGQEQITVGWTRRKDGR